MKEFTEDPEYTNEYASKESLLKFSHEENARIQRDESKVSIKVAVPGTKKKEITRLHTNHSDDDHQAKPMKKEN